MIRSLFARSVALVVSHPAVAAAIIRRAQRTPYFHLDNYMRRWWLFNGYPPKVEDNGASRQEEKRFPWLPSIRVHHILREDMAEHPHDHPWNFRTFILDGWYVEQREGAPPRTLRRGETASIRFGEYHHVSEVSSGGVWTMVVVADYRGKWGFLVNGQKMRPRDYAETYPDRNYVKPPNGEPEKLHIGGVDSDDECCVRCGSRGIDTGWECTECGYDNMPHYCPPDIMAKPRARQQ